MVVGAVVPDWCQPFRGLVGRVQHVVVENVSFPGLVGLVPLLLLPLTDRSVPVADVHTGAAESGAAECDMSLTLLKLWAKPCSVDPDNTSSFHLLELRVGASGS